MKVTLTLILFLSLTELTVPQHLSITVPLPARAPMAGCFSSAGLHPLLREAFPAPRYSTSLPHLALSETVFMYLQGSSLSPPEM